MKAIGKSAPLATTYRRKEYFKNLFNVVEPLEFFLDQKKGGTFQYIPLLQLLGCTVVLDWVISSHRRQLDNAEHFFNKHICSIRDGVYLREILSYQVMN